MKPVPDKEVRGKRGKPKAVIQPEMVADAQSRWQARATTRAVVSEVGADDREKLLLGYAERLASLHNLGMSGVQLDFERYVMDMSEGCLGAETEIAICDNAILADARKTGEIPEYATSRSVR